MDDAISQLEMRGVYTIPVENAEGQIGNLEAWRGKVLLIVNVASRCYFTKQYQQLEQLQRRFGQEQFSILAFPCNQFLNQEPGDIKSIKQNYCAIQKISFPIFNKINVNGPDTAPLYNFLKKQVQKKPLLNMIPWNFTKFLVDQHGQVIKRFMPYYSLQKIAEEVNALLQIPPAK